MLDLRFAALVKNVGESEEQDIAPIKQFYPKYNYYRIESQPLISGNGRIWDYSTRS